MGPRLELLALSRTPAECARATCAGRESKDEPAQVRLVSQVRVAKAAAAAGRQQQHQQLSTTTLRVPDSADHLRSCCLPRATRSRRCRWCGAAAAAAVAMAMVRHPLAQPRGSARVARGQQHDADDPNSERPCEPRCTKKTLIRFFFFFLKKNIGVWFLFFF
jgi:hypothetical protein